MAASLLGTTGNWGIPQDEAGILITDLSFDFSNQEKPVLDKGGEIIGLALYQEMAEVKLSGLVSMDTPFSGKVGAALTLANTVPSHLNGSGGTTIVNQISRSLNNEDFEKIDITAKYYPFVTAGGGS
ncbi:MAG: hypothetical protein H7A51_04030 [Akkermansiaceae bacterium]|nr:hypothetical protein [Akkermansiaceae bacterium]